MGCGAEGEDPRGVVRLLSLRDRLRDLSKNCGVYLEIERDKLEGGKVSFRRF